MSAYEDLESDAQQDEYETRLYEAIIAQHHHAKFSSLRSTASSVRRGLNRDTPLRLAQR